MIWLKKFELTWFQSFCANVLKTGKIPRHVAFIMDGNRRFARQQHVETIIGHMKGFEKLGETLQWCSEMGITEVTVYAFSIENFKRSQEEVTKLMNLAKEKFEEILREKEKIMDNGICIRVLGDLSYLPKDLQKLIAKTVLLSRHNTKATLNICLAYTSRNEIFQAVKEVCEGVQLDLIRPSDISEHVLSKCLYSSESKDPDMLVRTSGENRLSDFLLWQSSYTVLAFVSVFWPNFSIWNFFSAILYYQMHCDKAKELKMRAENDVEILQQRSDRHLVVEEIKAKLSGGFIHDKDDADELNKFRIEKYATEREARVELFLKHVHNKRIKILEDLLVN